MDSLLDHKRLKQHWKQVLDKCELPPDHYAVFKAVTRYSWVEREPLYKLFGITKKKQKQWRGPICSPEEFRTKVRSKKQTGLIKVKTDGKGVPQGSPISALLSNIYMLSADARMAPLVKEQGGLYFRYSDDILLVCPCDKRVELGTRSFEKRWARSGWRCMTDQGSQQSRCSSPRRVAF